MELIAAFWSTLVEVAPFLLLGFLLAGLISQLMPVSWVRRHLGGSGAGASVKAALFGIPLPICSCGVIPLAASLRDRGASKAATLSFLVATPQTSVDSVILCLVLVGPVFAIFSPVAALVAALSAGALFALVRGRHDREQEHADLATQDHGQQTGGLLGGLRRALAYGFGKMPGDIGREVLIGLGIAALIAVYLPQGVYGEYLGNGLLGKAAMVLAAVPLYVCSTASVPVVAALIAKGVSPGTAFVFFLAGPATNAATVATVAKVLGSRAVAAYLLAVSGVAIAAGVLMDIFFIDAFADLVASGHEHHDAGWLWQLAGIGLLAVLVWPSLKRLLRTQSAGGCCAAEADCCGGGTAPAVSACCGGETKQTASSCCGETPEQKVSSCCGGHAEAKTSACCGGHGEEKASACCGGASEAKTSACCGGPAEAAETTTASSCCGGAAKEEPSSPCCGGKQAS